MHRFIERKIEDKLADIIIEKHGESIFGISLSVSDGELSIETI